MDNSENTIDPQTEVRKLQDLVKKLEHQNELLRGKQKRQLETIHQNGDLDPVFASLNNVSLNNIENTKSKQVSESLDELELLDIDKVSKDEDDTWLYTSPKKPTPTETRVSPYKWVREEFDNPSAEVDFAKRTLSYKLDELARNSRKAVTPPQGRYSNLGRSPHYGADGSKQARKSPLYNAMGGKIDTSTFTRPKKSREKHNSGGDNSRDEDVPDVQMIAKLQEESLRQSTLTPPRKTSRGRSRGSGGDNNRSSPSRLEDGEQRQLSGSQSDQSTPPDSPYSSQYLSTSHGSGQLEGARQANGARLTNPPPATHSSDSSLDYQSTASDEFLYATDQSAQARRTQPARTMSPQVNSLKQPAKSSMQGTSLKSGLPQMARRSIPRPGSATKSSLPMPRRSNIPSPRQFDSSDASDEGWKEGCF